MQRVPKRVEVLIDNGHKPSCICCGSKEKLTFDHIIPLGKKGKDCNTNGQILCGDCNWLKGCRIISIEYLRSEISKN